MITNKKAKKLHELGKKHGIDLLSKSKMDFETECAYSFLAEIAISIDETRRKLEELRDELVCSHDEYEDPETELVIQEMIDDLNDLIG